MASKFHTAVQSSLVPCSLPQQSVLKKVAGIASVSVFLTAVLFQIASAEEMNVYYIYHLSDFSGPLPFNMSKMFADRERHEIYVIDENSAVKTFNNAGMETYVFNDDGNLGSVIIDLAVDKQGNILLLSASYGASRYYILKCNYRGDLMSTMELKNIPADFNPSTLQYRDGHLYMADKGSLRVIVTDEKGEIEQTIDLFPLLGVKKDKVTVDISGFSVAKEGDILFTVPALFRGYRLSPDGKLVAFGQPGGGEGKFNIIAGIITDDEGHYFVTDKLKCAVLIFDKDFNFITQVGYRGFNSPGGLIVPMEMAYMDKHLYVSSGAHQGVSVFNVVQ